MLGPVIRQAEGAAIAQNGRVTIIGEMVALLWAAERVDATIKPEHLWNGLARTHSFLLRCAYVLNQMLRQSTTPTNQPHA